MLEQNIGGYETDFQKLSIVEQGSEIYGIFVRKVQLCEIIRFSSLF